MEQAEAKEFAAWAMRIQEGNVTGQDILDVRNVSFVKFTGQDKMALYGPLKLFRSTSPLIRNIMDT